MNYGLYSLGPSKANGLRLTPAYAERVLVRIERSVVRLPDSDSIYSEWRRLVAQFGVSGKTTHDARLVAAMNIHSVKSIITFNIADFMRYTEIQAVRPVDVLTAPLA